MRPHNSQSSRENATPSSGPSLLASYKEVPPPPGLYAAFIIHWNVDHNSLSWVNGMCLLKFLMWHSICLLKVCLLRTFMDEVTHCLGSLWPTALQSEVYYHVARGSRMDLLKRALIRALPINQVDACSALYSNRTVKNTLGLVDVLALSFETRNI